MGGFMASRARNAQMLCGQEDTQKCLDYHLAWNSLEWGRGFGLKAQKVPLAPKPRTYHQPPAGPKDARQFSLSVVCLLNEKCWGELLTGTVTIKWAPLCLPLCQQGPPEKDRNSSKEEPSHRGGAAAPCREEAEEGPDAGYRVLCVRCIRSQVLPCLPKDVPSFPDPS